MKEVEVQSNTMGLKVFINETPDLTIMPKDELMILATKLEKVISKIIENGDVHDI